MNTAEEWVCRKVMVWAFNRWQKVCPIPGLCSFLSLSLMICFCLSIHQPLSTYTCRNDYVICRTQYKLNQCNDIDIGISISISTHIYVFLQNLLGISRRSQQNMGCVSAQAVGSWRWLCTYTRVFYYSHCSYKCHELKHLNFICLGSILLHMCEEKIKPSHLVKKEAVKGTHHI